MHILSKILMVISVFLTGMLVGEISSQYNAAEVEQPLSLGFIFGLKNLEKSSPSDHIKEKDIHVYDDKIVIDLKDATWSSFIDSNSMDPIIDIGANGIEIMPTSPDQINVGDVISYTSNYADGILIHRVIEQGYDDEGVYFILKGDNNPSRDPGKIRFEQVRGLLVGVIY